MRRLGVWGVVAVLAGASSAAAFGGVRETDDAAKGVAASGPEVSREDLVKILEARLAKKERELAELRALTASEDALYAEAETIGVVKAVARSGLAEPQQRRVSIAIVREAKKNGLDPLLVVAVIRCESSFNTFATSHVGAMGLMQVMPDTGVYLAEKRGWKLGKTQNLFDPETNIELGAWYLADLIERFGSVEHALVAYNAGPGLAKKILAKKENRKKFIAGYPKKVVGEWKKLQVQSAKLQQAARETAVSVSAEG